MAATSSLLARAHEQPSKYFVTWLTRGSSESIVIGAEAQNDPKNSPNGGRGK